jgi:hypothetical protein
MPEKWDCGYEHWVEDGLCVRLTLDGICSIDNKECDCDQYESIKQSFKDILRNGLEKVEDG